MSRRDTIIIAVLINTGLLAFLFMMAIHIEDDPISERIDVAAAIAQVEEPAEPVVSQPRQAPRDELDSVIQDLAAYEKQSEPKADPVAAVKPSPAPQQEVSKPSQKDFVEVTVKRGDSLDKIARANGTTISTLMSMNQLETDRLRIGQMLKVPVGGKTPSAVPVNQPAKSDEPEYYIVQNGDNPWKIAKKFHVRFDELLKLNHLDEAKARRLKAGDKLRVR